MDEFHDGYKLLRGVRLDIKTLLTNFESRDCIRFTTFCEEWKKMNFSLIFCQRKSKVELLEYCEEVIHIAKGYLEPPWNFPIRVGALFLLYGLYYKQPIKGAAKIRLVKEEWDQLVAFIKDCKEAKHYDICFVHYKMFREGAYTFTAIARATGWERGYRKYEIKNKLNKTYNETIVKRPNIIEPELLEKLETEVSAYCKKKVEVLGKRNLAFVNEDFAKRLSVKLGLYYTQVQEKYPAKTIEELTAAARSEHEATGVAVPLQGRSETILQKKLRMMKSVQMEQEKKDSEEMGSTSKDDDNNTQWSLPEI